jgi:hypothetical protein
MSTRLPTRRETRSLRAIKYSRLRKLVPRDWAASFLLSRSLFVSMHALLHIAGAGSKDKTRRKMSEFCPLQRRAVLLLRPVTLPQYVLMLPSLISNRGGWPEVVIQAASIRSRI